MGVAYMKLTLRNTHHPICLGQIWKGFMFIQIVSYDMSISSDKRITIRLSSIRNFYHFYQLLQSSKISKKIFT